MLHLLLHMVSVIDWWKVWKSLLIQSWVCGDGHLRLRVSYILRVLLLAGRLLFCLCRAARTILLHVNEQDIAIVLRHVGTALQQMGHHTVYSTFCELEELSASTYRLDHPYVHARRIFYRCADNDY